MPSPDVQLPPDSELHGNEPWSTLDGEEIELAQKMLGYCAIGGLPDADDQSTSAEGDGNAHKVTAISLQAWMQRQDDLARALLAGQSRLEMVLRDAAHHGSGSCAGLFQSEASATGSGKQSVISKVNKEAPLKHPLAHDNKHSGQSVALASVMGTSDAADHWRRRIRTQQRKRRGTVKPNKSQWIMKSDEAGDRPLYKLVHNRLYEILCISLVWVNAIYLGVQVEYQSVTQADMPHGFQFEVMFGIAFSFELILRACSDGRLMFSSKDAGWHIFDIVVVSMMWVEIAITAWQMDVGGNVSVLRIVRCARIVRVAKLVRTLNCFSELRMLILSIFTSAVGIVWVAAVVCVFIYVFSVALTQGALEVCNMVSKARLDPQLPVTCKHWGSIWWSFLSLYEAMTGGISWGELIDSLQPTGWFYMSVFIVFITFAIFVVANIITGIFVDSAMRAAKKDQASVIQEEMLKKEECISNMNRVFAELDVDDDGELLFDEFERAISDEHMVTYLATLGLEVADAKVLFCLLDRNRSGTVDIEDFIVGCMRLRGEARSLDVAMLQFQSDWLVEAMECVAAKVEAIYDDI